MLSYTTERARPGLVAF